MEAIFGDDDLEYFVSVTGEDLGRLLRLLFTDAASQRGGAIRDTDLRDIGDALVSRFGNDLQMVQRYRGWLEENEIRFSTFVH